MDEKTMLLFDDYLQGALSLKEQKELEQRIQEEPELGDAFAVFKDLNGHLEHSFSKERSDFRTQLKAMGDAHFKKSTIVEAKETKVIRFTPLRYLVAASVVFLFGTIMWMQLSTPTYADYPVHQDISLTIRTDGELAFAKAEKAFNTGAYEEAILFFNSILSNTPNNVEVSYYKGIALVELNRFDEADGIFSNITNGNSVYKYKALWSQALSKLKQKDAKACIKILQKIPAEAEDYEKAQDLLDKL
ncbi:MAG: tetratricopeptide (TPR) repeat protein [Gammaproteobacteria bacterium]|jgi:tetratricopeptide (TPR) repeat protein